MVSVFCCLVKNVFAVDLPNGPNNIVIRISIIITYIRRFSENIAQRPQNIEVFHTLLSLPSWMHWIYSCSEVILGIEMTKYHLARELDDAGTVHSLIVHFGFSHISRDEDATFLIECALRPSQ